MTITISAGFTFIVVIAIVAVLALKTFVTIYNIKHGYPHVERMVAQIFGAFKEWMDDIIDMSNE